MLNKNRRTTALKLNNLMTKSARESQEMTSDFSLNSHSFITQVADNLFFGGQIGATDLGTLQSFGIQVIVNLISSKLINLFQDYFVYENFDLIDDFENDICQQLQSITETIKRHILEGRKVLVHCRKGVSRAPTVVAAYLIRCNNFLIDRALSTVKNANPNVELKLWSEPALQELICWKEDLRMC